MTLFTTPTNDRFNKNGLFSHSKAEALLQRICKTVERHEIEITSVRCEVDSSQAQLTNDIGIIQSTILGIKSVVDDLNKRVELIEQSIRIPGTPTSSKSSVGEVIIANRRTIARTLNLVSQKADMEEVQVSIESQSKEILKTIDDVKNDFASTNAVEKCNDALSSLVAKIDVLDNGMANKVDKCQLKTLSSDASFIKNHASFIRIAQEQLKRIEPELVDLKDKISESSEKAKAIEEQITDIDAQFIKLPTNHQFSDIESAVQSLGAEIKKKVDTSNFHEVEEYTNDARCQLSSVGDDVKTLFAGHEALAKYLTRRLDVLGSQMATNETLSTYTTTNEFEEKFKQMRNMIDSKACRKSFIQLEQGFHFLESDLCITKRKADLAGQFIEMYGNDSGIDNATNNQ